MSEMTIGRTARSVGVNVETIRFYEREGLIDQPPKPSRGFRVYPLETLQRIRFIKRAQTLGFTLAEVSALLEFSSEQCHDVREKAQAKIGEIDEKIADLRRVRRALAEVVSTCGSRASGGCPILQALGSDGPAI